MPKTELKRQKHDYTSELELKCLLLRVNNMRAKNEFPEDRNSKIDRYIALYNTLNNHKYKDVKSMQRKVKLRESLKLRAIEMSRTTNSDIFSYERFGEIILLMIKNILKKPNFSGYTYTDDFYSDAVHKIVKYMHNFDIDKISKSTGLPVNAFAYISQIIHNSILFIIISKNKEQELIKEHIQSHVEENEKINTIDAMNIPNQMALTKFEREREEQELIIEEIPSTLLQEMVNLKDNFINSKDKLINLLYPKNYRIGFDEYNLICNFIKDINLVNPSITFNIIRSKRKF